MKFEAVVAAKSERKGRGGTYDRGALIATTHLVSIARSSALDDAIDSSCEFSRCVVRARDGRCEQSFGGSIT